MAPNQAYSTGTMMVKQSINIIDKWKTSKDDKISGLRFKGSGLSYG